MRKATVVLLVLLGTGTGASAQPAVGPAAASPSSVPVNVATPVVFTVPIREPAVIPNGVNLLKTDANGTALAIVGVMRDDGTNGDAIPGDQTFSLGIVLNESVAGPAYYRVSAAFKGVLLRVLSDLVVVRVGAKPALEITVALSPPPQASGWNNSPVTAHFTCVAPGSTVVSCPADQVVSADGVHTITGTMTDADGNTATASTTVRIDRTPPTIAVALSPGPDAEGLYTSPVTARFTCADAGSGVASCAPDQLLTTPGVNLTVTGSGLDQAGNAATVTSPPFTIRPGPSPAPTIASFSPSSASGGTLISVSGTGLAPNPRVILGRLGGGTIEAPVASVTPSSLAFTVPAGAATGPISVAVGPHSTVSATPLTIVASREFTLDVQPTAARLVGGQSVSFAVRLTSATAFAQLASLTVAGVPAGTTASLTPQRITAGQTSVLTVKAPPGTPVGAATLTVTASATVDGLPLAQNAVAQLNIETATTAFVGRTVVADALQTPLAGVTVTMLGKNGNGGTTSCAGSTVSDGAGNFSLSGLGAACVGPQLVGYDGTTATSPEGEYAGVNIVYTLAAGQVTTSPVLVNLPRIDDKETFQVQQNAAINQSYRYTTIPGLSVTVYAGTTFTLPDGSKPDPFPLVAVQVPVDRLPDAKPPVPTMLSAFIVAFQPANAVASKPAAVFYPNTLNTDPGVSMTLMTLDPTLGRMVPYGTATVAANGTQIVPDLNPALPGTRYGIVNFDWHGPMPPPAPPNRPQVNPPPDPTCPPHPTEPERPRVGQPCDVTSGLETVTQTDIAISGSRGGIAVVRTYRTLSNNPGPFGIGSNHNYSYFLAQTAPQNALLVNLIVPEGNWLPFSRTSLSDPLVNDTIPSMQGVRLNTFPDGHAELRWKNGTVYRFAAATAALVPALESITDANGNRISLTRNSARPIEIAQITDAVGRSLTLTYDGGSRVTMIADPIGRRVRYAYNAQGMLEKVTDPEEGVTRYDYDAENRLIKHTDAREVVVARNTYESHGRVAQQIQADGGVYRFEYTFVNPTIPSSPVLANVVTDPMERATAYRFTPDGLLTDVWDHTGQARLVVRDPGKANQVVAYQGTAPCATCGNAPASPGDVSYTYDDRGNVRTETDALGRTTTYAYEPTFNRVTSVTDALGHTTLFTYDDRGNMDTRTDASGRTTSFKYDAFGQLTETTDALKQQTRFVYDGAGNLTTVTDALSQVTRLRYDAVSRLVEVRDSLGNQTLTEYDGLDRVVKQTDAKGGTTLFAYDASGNLTSLTDARGNKTAFTYDDMNRLKTRTDPVGKVDTRTYDRNGNLVSFTDRRGQTSSYLYDDLDRLKEERYADGSVVTRAYDATGRLVQVADSEGGDFTFAHNLTGALVSSNGPTGAVKYLRDELGRVQQRRVVGQPAVDYAYDPLGNLSAAAMADVAVNFAYDSVGRPLTLTRSNGVKTDYGYDPVGRLLSIVHSRGAANLVSLGYSYDAAGRRVSQQSSSAQPLITEPAVATFDDANRLVQRGSTSYSYDENGNLTAEAGPTGTTTYVWDGRNRLSRIQTPNGQTTVFTYDFADNLIRQTDAGPIANSTRFYTLDDVSNVAFEQRDGGDHVSILTGSTIDTHLATRWPSGEVHYALMDSINSTIATVDQSGSIIAPLYYEPFGSAANGSMYPFQYTGRVPVADGLYYYRSRFYSPTTGRFISEDSIGLAGGNNLYAYVNNNPLNLTDPFGFRPNLGQLLQCLASCLISNLPSLVEISGELLGDVFATTGPWSPGSQAATAELASCLRDCWNEDDSNNNSSCSLLITVPRRLGPKPKIIVPGHHGPPPDILVPGRRRPLPPNIIVPGRSMRRLF